MTTYLKRILPVAIFWLLLLLATPYTHYTQADGVIHNLKAKLTDSELLTSYQLRGAMDNDVWRTIRSGEQTSFNYDIQLFEEHRFWLDRKVAQIQVANSIKLDTLTNQYNISRRINGEIVETKKTTRADEVEQWLTQVQNVRIIGRSSLTSRNSYLLQVRAHLKSDFIFYIVPWEVYTPWEAINIRIP